MKKLSAAKEGVAYCYILECADGSYYTGWTNNLPRRFREHSAKRGGRYTRSRCPVALIYFEPQADASAARKREAAIKQLPRAKKAELAAGRSRSRKPAAKKNN
jgi:putative endonuclease